MLLFLIGHTASSYWIWTPELGKWINPKNYVRDTPEEQFNLGYKLYQEENHKKAIDAFKKLIKYFPKSKYAPEAQFYVGQAYERLGNSLEYKIGNLFFVRSNKERTLLEKISFLDDNTKAIEIFQKVVENSPYGKYASLAQFKLGLLYRRIHDFANSEESFKNVITNYPASDLVDDAVLQLAEVASEKEHKVDYSQEGTEVAIKRLEELSTVGKMPEEGEKVLEKLKERKAESLFNTAKFYEKQKLYPSAVIYYEEVVKKYPRSDWAVKAIEKAAELKKKGNK